MVKSLSVMQETLVRSLHQEDSPKKGMTTHSSLPEHPMDRSLAGYSHSIAELDTPEAI